jgi:hypothetical protein
MKSKQALIIVAIAASGLVASSCGGSPPAAANKNAASNSNAAASNKNGNQNKNAASAGLPARIQPVGGTIEVNSNPSGATVLLIPEDEAGAQAPQRRGSTPTTITGLAPGKYAVQVEKYGFSYFQKDVEIKKEEKIKISAKLKKAAT